MKLKLLPLAAAVSAAVALGSAGEAAASVYAGSRLLVDNLTVVVSPLAGATVNNFNFNLTNTATLNGGGDIESAVCSGLPSPGANTCNAANPRLDAAPAQLGDAAANYANNAFTFIGPSAALEFANSDSVIQEAQLAGDASTQSSQIAETELQTGQNASASAEIQSTTGFTFTFTLATPGSLVLDFDADPHMLAAINDATPGATFLSQGNMTFTVTLSQDGGDDFVQWQPQGSPATNNCIAIGGPTCTEDNDDEDLNNQVGVSSHPNSAPFSTAVGFSDFGITITGLLAGDYTFTLNATTSTLVTRNVVPEPGTLLLLGSGFAALGIGGVRRKKKRSV